MGQVYSIVPGLPGCQKTEGKETKGSIGLRVAAVALGATAATMGILALAQVPGLSLMGIGGGATTLSLGVVLAAASISIKRIKKEESQSSRRESVPSNRKVPEKVEKEATSESYKEEEESSSSEEKMPPVSIPESVKESIETGLLKSLPPAFFKDFPYVKRCPGWNTSPDWTSQNKLKFQAPISTFSNLDGSGLGIFVNILIKYIPSENNPNVRENIDKLFEIEQQMAHSFYISKPVNPFGNSSAPTISKWFLYSEDLSTSSSSPETIFPKYLFNICDVCELSEETIQNLIETKNQDDLSPEFRFSALWILLRLKNRGHLLLRDNATSKNDFQQPATGYWKISLDN